MREVFRPLFGRVLTVVIGALATIAEVTLLVTDVGGAVRSTPWLALLVGACWALFWRPQVTVDDAGVHLVNPFRTIDVPWPAIQAVDTKWALTLVTAYGRFTGWAAPAPGVRETVRAGPEEARHLPSTTAVDGGVRPGDLPSSPSGGAALMIRRHWERLRDAGHLDDPRLEFDRAPVRWHHGTLAVGVVLAVAAVAGLIV